MNKNLKEILITGASLLILAGISTGLGNLSTNAHASNLSLDQYASSWERRDGITHWGVSPAVRGAYIVRHGRHKGWLMARYYAKKFYKNGHSFLIRANVNTPGTIIAMDGNHHVSNAAVKRALAPRHHHVSYNKIKDVILVHKNGRPKSNKIYSVKELYTYHHDFGYRGYVKTIKPTRIFKLHFGSMGAYDRVIGHRWIGAGRVFHVETPNHGIMITRDGFPTNYEHSSFEWILGQY